MDINKNIANNIRLFRERAGLTQKELAGKLYLSNPSTIQKWEVGRNRVYPEYLYELCKIFGVKMEDTIMERENKLSRYYKETEGVYSYDMSYPEAITYTGLEDVVEGLVKFNREEYDECDIDRSKNIDDESYRILKWEEDNSFFIAVGIDDGEIYGLRDFGRYRPFATDILFSSDLLPIGVGEQPDGTPVKLTELTEEDWEEWSGKWLEEIKEKAAYLRETYKREMERYRNEAEEGKSLLFITSNNGMGEYSAYDIENGVEYVVEKYDSDNTSFYFRNESSSEDYDLLSIPLSKKADGSFKLFFPDREMMWVMGIDHMPQSFADMSSRKECEYEAVKKYSFDDVDTDELYERIIYLINTFPIMERDSIEYENLKSVYEAVTEKLQKNEEIDQELIDDMFVYYDLALNAIY